jgi:hypothetical protein
VENDSKPATYSEVVYYIDLDKWISYMQEEMRPVEKDITWDVVHLPKKRMSSSATCGYIRERNVFLIISLQGLRQG